MEQQTIRYVDLALFNAYQVTCAQPWNANPQFLTEAQITYAIIHLHDALQKLKTHIRVNFKDDVLLDGEDKDITDLISSYRNAACHFASGTRQVDQNARLSFGLAIGKGNLLQTGEITLTNPYDDDVAYFYGNTRLLHYRQIHRSVLEAIENLKTISKTCNYPSNLLTSLIK